MEFENVAAEINTPPIQNVVNEENPRPQVENSLAQEMENIRLSPAWPVFTQSIQHLTSLVVQRCVVVLYIYLILLILFLLKLILTHITGFITISVLVIIFNLIQSAVHRQIEAKMNRSKLVLIWIISFLTFVLFAFYYLFADESLHLVFTFQAPLCLYYDSQSIHLATVLWITVCTDLATKCFVLIIKCIFAVTPSAYIISRRKTFWYQCVEYTSHLYRHWLPVPIWCAYLSFAPNAGYVIYIMTYILSISYFILKLVMFRSKFSSWFLSAKFLLNPLPFGCYPNATDLIQAGPNCSICSSDFVSPIQLICKHIFCEECILTWLDKETTCPVCRAKIGTEDRSWRDGSTSYGIQIC